MSSLYDTWCVRNVKIDYALLGLHGGASDEAIITITEGAPRFSTKACISGKHAVSLSSNTSVTLQVSLELSSDQAKILYNVYQGLKQSVGTSSPVLGAAPFTVIDASGNYTLIAREAALQSVSDISFGEESGNVSFTLFVPDALAGKLPEKLNTELAAVQGFFEI